MRRRAAIERVIGHLKEDHRMGRNYLTGRDALAKTVPEFITYAKANPGKITMASGGNGGPSHVSGRGRRISGETAHAGGG